MKTSWLSLLAGVALVGGVGFAGAAEPVATTSSQPVLLSADDLDQITAAGWERKKWNDHFKKKFWHKKFDKKKWHAKKVDGKTPAPAPTPPAPGDQTYTITVNVGEGAVANVAIVIGNNNIVKQVNVIDIVNVNKKFVAKKK